MQTLENFLAGTLEIHNLIPIATLEKKGKYFLAIEFTSDIDRRRGASAAIDVKSVSARYTSTNDPIISDSIIIGYGTNHEYGAKMGGLIDIPYPSEIYLPRDSFFFDEDYRDDQNARRTVRLTWWLEYPAYHVFAFKYSNYLNRSIWSVPKEWFRTDTGVRWLSGYKSALTGRTRNWGSYHNQNYSALMGVDNDGNGPGIPSESIVSSDGGTHYVHRFGWQVVGGRVDISLSAARDRAGTGGALPAEEVHKLVWVAENQTRNLSVQFTIPETVTEEPYIWQPTSDIRSFFAAVRNGDRCRIAVLDPAIADTVNLII